MRNKLNPDGSINLGNHINAIVSPYDTDFYNDIEEGVKDSVRTLLDMGYLTIASCDGNHEFNGEAQVTVALGSKQWAYTLIYDLKQLGIDASIDTTFSHFGIDQINKLFMRRYSEYACVKIFMYNHKLIFLPFKQFIINKNTGKLALLERYTT